MYALCKKVHYDLLKKIWMVKKILSKKNLTAEEKFVFKSSFDWERMTVQDELVWEEIYKHLI